MLAHSEVLNVLLSHSKGLLDEEALERNDGFQVYVIELTGLDFIIEAKRTSKVGFTYIVRAYDRRFKVYTASPRSEAMSSLIPKPAPVPSASSTMPRVQRIKVKPIPRSSSAVVEAQRIHKKKK